MPHAGSEELPVFVAWMEFVQWLLPVMEKIPKRFRFSLADRIDNLALDTVEDLVEARYSRRKTEILRRSNLRLEKIRILLRICHAQQFISHESYEHAMRQINNAGRMLGGWIKQGADREAGR